MRIEQITKLATDAANGKDNFKKGAVGSNEYGFVFKDSKSHLEEPYIVPYGWHKLCDAGAYRDQLKNIKKKLKNYDKSDFFSGILRYDNKLDLLFAGSVKTLVPTLQFGGFLLFEAWMFVITPEGRIFPATLYWGQTGLSIGAWSGYSFMGEKDLLEDFPELKTFSPFDFTDDETGLFLDALEFALKKVPVSDFWGVFNRDIGNSYMGVKRGKPFHELMQHFKSDPNNSEAEKELEPLLDREFKDEYGESFSIRLLHGMRIYVVQPEYELEWWDKYFGNAKDVLDLYKKII